MLKWLKELLSRRPRSSSMTGLHRLFWNQQISREKKSTSQTLCHVSEHVGSSDRAEFGIHTKEQEEKTKQNRKSHFTTYILVKSDTTKKVVLKKHLFEEGIKNYLTHFER